MRILPDNEENLAKAANTLQNALHSVEFERKIKVLAVAELAKEVLTKLSAKQEKPKYINLDYVNFGGVS